MHWTNGIPIGIPRRCGILRSNFRITKTFLIASWRIAETYFMFKLFIQAAKASAFFR